MMAFLRGQGERPLSHGCNSTGRGNSVKSRVDVSRVLPAKSRSTQHPGAPSTQEAGACACLEVGWGALRGGWGWGDEVAWGHQLEDLFGG